MRELVSPLLPCVASYSVLAETNFEKQGIKPILAFMLSEAFT